VKPPVRKKLPAAASPLREPCGSLKIPESCLKVNQREAASTGDPVEDKNLSAGRRRSLSRFSFSLSPFALDRLFFSFFFR
jgi:hypothetical protein